MEIVNVSGLEMADVERGADNLPKAWPLLRVGDNFLTLKGRVVNLQLSEADLRGVADYHAAKGARIPVDCNHVISNLAGKIGVDESEIVRKLPRCFGVAGFGKLEMRGDALYLADVEFLPIGREVVKAGQFRYFSPTLRGLDGASPLRLTSVALTNEPCLQNIASLAASEEGDDEIVTPEMVREAQESVTKQKEKETMNENPAPIPPENGGHAADAELLGILREVLGEEITPENLKSALAALKTKADAMPELKKTVERLEAAEEWRELTQARDTAFSRGKLTPAMLERPYFQNMTAAELSEYCKSVDDGCACPVKTLELGEPRPKTPPQAEAKTYHTVSEAIAAAPVKPMNE